MSTNIGPSAYISRSPAVELGRILRTLRKTAGATGVQLGERAGLSQSKISKIEHGIPPLPGHDVILQILDILDAPSDIRRDVKLLLARLGMSISKVTTYPFDDNVAHYFDLELRASRIQVVVFNMIPALLQTAVYREAVLKGHGLDDEELKRAMSLFGKRQENLWSKSVTFEFLLAEASLYTMVSTREVQLAQLDKLERYVGLSNIEIGIIPLKAGLHRVEPSNFVLYDKQFVSRAFGNMDVVSEDSETVMQHIRIFEELGLKAKYGPEAARLIAEASQYMAAADDVK